MNLDLIRKYNIPGPRYTSYPTVPFWKKDLFSLEEWLSSVKETFRQTNKQEGISLYIHLPYCESLCTYCGCNKRITVNHNVEIPYIKAVLQEWNLYLSLFEEKPLIKEIHLGGGTPTFFSPENLKMLLDNILKKSRTHKDYSFSFEAHPKNTSGEHLQTLFDLGFKRLSLGIQDFDAEVQKTVNRIQPYEMVEKVVNQARKTGYESVNFDLIYGLPKQTLASVTDTIEKVNKLKPERIAFYSYAHVPWKSKSQRGYSETDLPVPEVKRQLYETGKALFEANGYVEIGMDHFALPSDGLYQAFKTGNLHRNFMGYTSGKTSLLIGLGVSSISESNGAFAQNEKVVENYTDKLEKKELPITTGHILSEEDKIIREGILDIMCRFETDLQKLMVAHENKSDIYDKLKIFEEDGLIYIENDFLKVTEKGRAFVRNICMVFDKHLTRQNPTQPLFSSTV
ncbi:MAG: oxygen-independent coproporphyrinogen III oxidase [Bacteroidetes bacterium]|nr:MAG: oxygen-independent coproporphyrinogen III oxidase [Bacteroidota bacterium]